MTAANPAMARCKGRLSGEIISVMAAIQVGRGGFSNLNSPFMVGTGQVSSYTISRAVMIVLDSMISAKIAPLLMKEKRQAENEKEERQGPAIVLCKGDSCHKTFF